MSKHNIGVYLALIAVIAARIDARALDSARTGRSVVSLAGRIAAPAASARERSAASWSRDEATRAVSARGLSDAGVMARYLIGGIPSADGSDQRIIVPSVVAPAPAGYSRASAEVAANFDFDEMYRNGAKVAKVYGPKDDGYRLISMKIYTMKQSDGSLQSFIGIVDITDPSEPYSPRYTPVTFSGSKSVQMKDGGRQYELSIKSRRGEREVVLMREGTREGDGAALMTSVDELFRLRADQAASGSRVDIGGAQFYALGQGGVHGSLLFFPQENIDARQSLRDTIYLRPVAMADVSRVDADGATVPMSGSPDLGEINGEPYHLVLIGGGWVVQPGSGDKN